MDTITTNRPIRFGPFDVELLIAHRHGACGCPMIVGDREKIEQLKLDLSGYGIVILPADGVCIVRHQRIGNKTCTIKFDQGCHVSRWSSAKSATRQTARAGVGGAKAEEPLNPPEPDPVDPPEEEPIEWPNPDPVQICLCPLGEYVCDPGDEPDCDDINVCAPA